MNAFVSFCIKTHQDSSRKKINLFLQILLTACVAASQAQILAAPYGAYGAYGALPYAAGAPIIQAGALPYAAGAPIIQAAAPAPVVAAAPLNPSSQFQAQDEFGNVQYGYSNVNSQKHEVGNTYTGVQGSYSYVDANGVVQTTNYIADGLGFRVQATNLPVAPVAELAQPVFNLAGPAPVEDTPEVAAAKAEFQAAFDEAAARAKRSTPAATEPLTIPAPVLASAPLAYGLPLAHAGYAPYAAAPLAYAPYAAAPYAVAPYAAPAVVASAPAAAEATLTTVKLNPGHAVAYRVD